MNTINEQIKNLIMTKKAWQVWHWGMISYNPNDGYLKDHLPLTYAETAGKAKSNAIECSWYELNGDEHKYTDLKARRYKEADKYLFNNRELPLSEIKDIIETNIRDNDFDILAINNIGTYAYILKGGSYYGSNYCGYTEYPERAGIYPILDAVRECKGCSLRDHMRPILIDIDEHNNRILDKINDLKSRLL